MIRAYITISGNSKRGTQQNRIRAQSVHAIYYGTELLFFATMAFGYVSR